MKEAELILNWQGGQFKVRFKGEVVDGDKVIGGLFEGSQFRYRDGPWEDIPADHLITCLEYGLDKVLAAEVQRLFFE